MNLSWMSLRVPLKEPQGVLDDMVEAHPVIIGLQ